MKSGKSLSFKEFDIDAVLRQEGRDRRSRGAASDDDDAVRMIQMHGFDYFAEGERCET
jgi:hypothetical protein